VKIDRAKFFAGYRRAFGSLSQSQVDGLTTLLSCIESDQVLTANPRYVSYFLATTKHETADTWQPIRERGGKEYFVRRYWHNKKICNVLGNQSLSDAYTYCGHGYVQITGRGHFETFSGLLGVDLLTTPELALEAEHSYRIASLGMCEGLFTGKRLGQYLDGKTWSYYDARRCVNGTDQAAKIAGLAQQFDHILTASIMPRGRKEI